MVTKYNNKLSYRDLDWNLNKEGFENFALETANIYNSKNKMNKAEIADSLGIKKGTLDTILNYAQNELGTEVNRRKSRSQEERLQLYSDINLLREKGKTYKQIGDLLGISSSYAGKVYRSNNKSEELKEKPSNFRSVETVDQGDPNYRPKFVVINEDEITRIPHGTYKSKSRSKPKNTFWKGLRYAAAGVVVAAGVAYTAFTQVSCKRNVEPEKPLEVKIEQSKEYISTRKPIKPISLSIENAPSIEDPAEVEFRKESGKKITEMLDKIADRPTPFLPDPYETGVDIKIPAVTNTPQVAAVNTNTPSITGTNTPIANVDLGEQIPPADTNSTPDKITAKVNNFNKLLQAGLYGGEPIGKLEAEIYNNENSKLNLMGGIHPVLEEDSAWLALHYTKKDLGFLIGADENSIALRADFDKEFIDNISLFGQLGYTLATKSETDTLRFNDKIWAELGARKDYGPIALEAAINAVDSDKFKFGASASIDLKEANGNYFLRLKSGQFDGETYGLVGIGFGNPTASRFTGYEFADAESITPQTIDSPEKKSSGKKKSKDKKEDPTPESGRDQRTGGPVVDQN